MADLGGAPISKMWPPLKPHGKMWPPLKTTFPKRAWQATLAGTADDPGGARGRPGADGRQRTPIDGGVASDRGGDGGRLWFDEDGTS